MIDIEQIEHENWTAVKKIYREGISTGNATFETEVPDWQAWDEAHLKEMRLLASKNGEVLGWAALSPVSSRCVYAGVAEASIYIASNARGKGVGTILLNALVETSEQNEIWTLQAGIFTENKASIALFKSCGFHKVGVREKLGKLNDRWRDVVLMERRSRKTGIN